MKKLLVIMKKLLVLFVLLTAGMAFAQEVKAQYAGPIARKAANLVDQNGKILSDEAIIGLVGEDIYRETVVGARRQMKSGTGLIIGGSAGIAAGLVFAIWGAAINNQSNIKMGDNHNRQAYNREQAKGAVVNSCALALSSLGSLAIGGGIAFRSIGKGRLGWVAEQCNTRHSATLEWSASPVGAGIVMRF